MTPDRLVSVTLALAALITSALTLLTAVVGMLIANRELRRNTKITRHADAAIHDVHMIVNGQSDAVRSQLAQAEGALRDAGLPVPVSPSAPTPPGSPGMPG